MKFKEFLASKNITEEAFGKMDDAEKVKLFADYADGNTQKAIDALKKEYDAKLEGALSKEQKETLLKEHADLAAKVAALGEKAKDFGNGEQTDLVKFFTRPELAKKIETKTNGMDKVTIKAAALMSTTNVVPNVAGGFNQLFGNFIDPEIYRAPKPQNFILGLVDVAAAPGTENIWYVERTNLEGNAQFIAEGALKPLADGEYLEKKADVKELAVRWKITNRLANHAPSVIADFLEHANELMDQEADTGVLTGTGVGTAFVGIASVASAFIVPTQLANYYTAPNIFDVIMAAATRVRLNNFNGQIDCVLNTVWEAKMFGVKEGGNSNAYILPSFVAPDGSRVGSVRVTFQNKMPEAKILIGELRRFKVRISEDVAYYEGWSNDDFDKNLSSRKLEAFMGSYLPSNHVGAIIYDDVATILDDIDAAGV